MLQLLNSSLIDLEVRQEFLFLVALTHVPVISDISSLVAVGQKVQKIYSAFVFCFYSIKKYKSHTRL